MKRRILLIPAFILAVGSLFAQENTEDTNAAHDLIVNPIPVSEEVFPEYIAFATESGALFTVGGRATSCAYSGGYSVEWRIPGTTFGLRGGLDLSPDLGVRLGARVFFPGPRGLFVGIRGDVRYNQADSSIYGIAGVEAGWRFVFKRRDDRGGSFFVEPVLGLDGSIANFDVSSSFSTNQNGFYVQEFRPSISVGVGYMFH
jgi:hypothetical protein